MPAGESIPDAAVTALRYEPGVLRALDQTVLPHREVELELRTAEDVAAAIRRLSIRGAPLIGVAAAYGLALAAAADPRPDAVQRAYEMLLETRPTAVNLRWALDRVRTAAVATDPANPAALGTGSTDPAGQALAEARRIDAEEQAASRAMAAAGGPLLAGAGVILTHCNTGALAAPGRGTALGLIAQCARSGSLRSVIATESRPLLQGARLTVWELERLGIPHELIVDSAAAGMIARGAADAVVLGCDRVAANGDVANKVGTYGLALAAREAGIPFVVVGPVSTIDPRCPAGDVIEIEERDPGEVRSIAGHPLTVPGTPCRNPAFDVTPARLVSALVTDRGVAAPVNAETVSALLAT
jgi:methylthioribose-1-phosphate isomerase